MLILLGLFVFLRTQAQNFFPIPEQSGFWYKQRSTPNGNCFTDIFHISDDSLIRGKKYQKLYVDRSGTNVVFDSVDAEFLCFVRNDGARRLQITFANDFADRLHFDFNLQQGDSAIIYPFSTVPYKIRIVSIDTVAIQNEPRRRWTVDGEYPSEWIEGIGCMNGWFSPPSVTGFAESHIQCFYLNDSLVYQRNTNPCVCLNTSALVAITDEAWTQQGRSFTIHSALINSCTISDLSGRVIFETQEKKFTLPEWMYSGIYLLSIGQNRLNKIYLP